MTKSQTFFWTLNKKLEISSQILTFSEYINFVYRDKNTTLKMISSNCDLLGHRLGWNSPLVLWRPLWLLLKVLEGVELLVAQNLGFLLWHLLNQSNYFPCKEKKSKILIINQNNFFPLEAFLKDVVIVYIHGFYRIKCLYFMYLIHFRD